MLAYFFHPFTTYFTPKLDDFRCPGIIFVVDVSGTCDAFLATVADRGALMDTTSEPTEIEIIVKFPVCNKYLGRQENGIRNLLIDYSSYSLLAHDVTTCQ
jgi:hypothetical protein